MSAERVGPRFVLCAVLGLLGGPAYAARGLEAGAGCVTITPRVDESAPPVWLAGYGQGRRATAVHDDIYARAFYVRDDRFSVAIVACDLIGLFRDEVLRIRQELARLDLRPPVDYVLVCSTHTHAAPDTLGLWGPIGRTGISPGYLERVRRACVDAVRQAHASARSAQLVIATADVNRSGELIGDSRLPKVIDSTMTIIQAREPSGRALVTLVNVPSHPEVLGGRNTHLSSDFPSSLRQYLEERFGGTAVYTSGSIGGLLSPRVPRSDPFTNEPMPAGDLERMTAYGRIIGRIAEKALQNAAPLVGPIRVRSREFLAPVWNPFYRLGMGLRVLDRQVFDEDGRPLENLAKLTPTTMPASAATTPAWPVLCLKSEVALLQIGPLQVAAIPGEIYPELTLGRFQRPQDPAADFPEAPLEPTVFPSLRSKYRMVIGLANDEIGYIIPKSQWDWEAPFAYGRKERQYGEINSCGPEVAPRLMEAFQALLTAE